MDRFAGTPERPPEVAVSASSPVIIAKAYTTNLVAVIQAASKDNSAPVILWPHSASEAPYTPWSLHDLGDGSYQVAPGTNPKGRLDVAHGSTADGAQVIQYPQGVQLTQYTRAVPAARAAGGGRMNRIMVLACRPEAVARPHLPGVAGGWLAAVRGTRAGAPPAGPANLEAATSRRPAHRRRVRLMPPLPGVMLVSGLVVI
jgi:Ricin-type beta-trefoil lectin domain-like